MSVFRRSLESCIPSTGCVGSASPLDCLRSVPLDNHLARERVGGGGGVEGEIEVCCA